MHWLEFVWITSKRMWQRVSSASEEQGYGTAESREVIWAYSVRVLEARRLKSGVGKVLSVSQVLEGSEGNLFPASLLASGGCWQSLVFLVQRCITPVSTAIFIWSLLCVPCPNFSFLTRTPVMGLRATLTSMTPS